MIDEKKAMFIVDKMCTTQSTDCRSLNKSIDARQLMDMINVPLDAEICEIPLDWFRQTIILFKLPKNQNYYSLFIGNGFDDKFHFDLTIEGIIKEDLNIDFYDNVIELETEYFIKKV